MATVEEVANIPVGVHGESPLAAPNNYELLWTDVVNTNDAGLVRLFDTRNGTEQCSAFDSFVGTVVPTRDGNIVVSTNEQGFAKAPWPSTPGPTEVCCPATAQAFRPDTLRKICTHPHFFTGAPFPSKGKQDGHWVNDGKCDPHGERTYPHYHPHPHTHPGENAQGGSGAAR